MFGDPSMINSRQAELHSVRNGLKIESMPEKKSKLSYGEFCFKGNRVIPLEVTY